MKTGSVIKRIALLLMVAALAVAMVACQDAVGPKGDTGPPGKDGAPGKDGPKGDPGDAGTSGNSPPMASALPNVYIALGGTGVTPMKMKSIDLNKYFTDAESAQIDFKAVSSEPTVASVGTGVLAMGMLKITGKKAGTATITVHAYDNVNDPVAETINVTVVNLNSAPTGSIPSSETKKLAAILYKKNGQIVRTISATTNPGPAGTIQDSVTAKVKYWPTGTVAGDNDGADRRVPIGGTGASATDTPNEVKAADAKVLVSITAGTKAGTWDVTMTPQKEGKEIVVIYFEDMFGSQVMAAEVTVHVNTIPKLAVGNPMKDVTIYHAAGANQNPTSHIFEVSHHFDGINVTDAMNTADPPALIRDASCSVTTTQPVSESGHASTADDVTATVTANHIALVTLAYVQGTAPDASVDILSTVTVAGGATTAAAKQGQFIITITCEDDEVTVSDSATITVR